MARRGMATSQFPAPKRGWIESINAATAPKDSAAVLENFFPTLESARLRAGCRVERKIEEPGGVVSLFARNIGTPRLFAATRSKVADALGGGDVLTGLTGGEWSTTHISSDGGDFLVGVNGLDEGFVSDGQAFTRYYHSSGTGHEMHGISTRKLSRVWNFKERLYFIERGTMNAWYLAPKAYKDTDSAEITKLPLGSLFERGGSLLFGATFSLDAGDGLDDHCVFVTDRGEVAVFSGLYPGSQDWTIDGRYVIAPPVHTGAHFHIGGDLAILTLDGIVSMTKAARGDRIAASNSALTRPIADSWRQAAADNSFPTHATLWRGGAMLLAAVRAEGGDARAFVMNAETGAWCVYTGWDVRCSCELNGRLYFGSSDGSVCEAEASGADYWDGSGGTQYVGAYIPKFQDFGTADRKILMKAGMTYRAPKSGGFEVTGLADQDVNLHTLDAPQQEDEGVAVTWGSFTWGAAGAVWGGGSVVTEIQEEWHSVRGAGRSVSLGIAVASNGSNGPAFEIVSSRLRYEVADDL